MDGDGDFLATFNGNENGENMGNMMIIHDKNDDNP